MAEAGARRAARQPPTMPASRPPTTAAARPMSAVPPLMGAVKWMVVEAVAAVAWWKRLPAVEAPTAVPEVVEVSAGPEGPDGRADPDSDDHAQDPAEDPDADRLGHDLTHHGALGPADGPQRADLAHPLGHARQGEQGGDEEGGQQHDDGQRPAQVRGEGVGVRQAPADLVGERLGRQHLSTRQLLLDGGPDGADVGRAVDLDRGLVDAPGVVRQLLQGGQVEVDVGGVAREGRVDQPDDGEGGVVDGQLLTDLDLVGVGVGGVDEDLVGRVGAEPRARLDLGLGDQPDAVVARVDPGHGVGLGLGVGRRRVEHPRDGLGGHDHLGLVLLEALGQALREGGAEATDQSATAASASACALAPGACAGAAGGAAGTGRRSGREGAAGLQAGPHRGLFGRGERSRAGHRGDGLAARREGVGVGRHGARLVEGLEGEGGDGGLDALDLLDVGHGRLGVGDEGAGHEEVMGEGGPWRSELGEVGQDRRVGVQQGRLVAGVELIDLAGRAAPTAAARASVAEEAAPSRARPGAAAGTRAAARARCRCRRGRGPRRRPARRGRSRGGADRAGHDDVGAHRRQR